MVMRLGDMPTIAITFVIIGVVVAVGLAIQSDVQEDIGTDYGNTSYAYNATGDAIEGTAELSDKLPLIGLVVAFSVLLGILGEFLFGGMR
jgi:hypothetical protein